MKSKMNLVRILLGAAALLLSAGAAQAQASRTWVSGVGDDVNPCSRTAPCKTFAGAISKTATGGEINCLDSGGFGTVTIIKSISIVCEGTIAGVLGASTYGITVNLPALNDRVVLQGLDIEGFGDGAMPGIHGVRIIGSGNVTIRKSSIRNFGQYGVFMNGTNNARLVIDQSLIIGNALGGLKVQGNGGSNFAFVNNSLFDHNGPASLTIASQGNITVSGSAIHGASAAFVISGGGSITSSGDNVGRGTGSPSATVPRL
jgi:hypothetical protein